jgi:nitrogen regulatory protein PII-like uncharacterized protein
MNTSESLLEKQASLDEHTVYIKPIIRNTHLPKSVQEDQEMRIGSQFEDGAVMRPINHEEEVKYLYPYLDIREEDRDARTKTKRFWQDLVLKVPFHGVLLEVGKDANGNLKNSIDWFRYKLATKHIDVANSKKDADNKYHVRFYIHDVKASQTEENTKVQLEIDAYKELAMISDKEEQLEYVLRTLGETMVDKMSHQKRQNVASRLLKKDPEKFLKVVRDKNLEFKSMISELVEYNIVENIAGTYMYKGDPIAESESEMVNFLKSQKNSKRLHEFKAQLRELNPQKHKAKAAKAKRKTVPEEEETTKSE